MPPKRTKSTAVAATPTVDTPLPLPASPLATAPATAPAAPPAPPAAPAAVVSPPEKKKKEKKIKIVAVVTPNGIEGSFNPEPRKPLICHLPFESKEVRFTDQPLRYDPTPPIQEPEPYLEGDTEYFNVHAPVSNTGKEENTYAYSDTWTMEQKVGGDLEENGGKDGAGKKGTGGGAGPVSTGGVAALHVATPPAAQSWKSFGENFQRCDLMTCYKKGEQFTIPESTQMACFWCSMQFSTKPCFLPMREEKGVFHIYGNFCSPQCGLAYVLKEALDPHVRWERMALLHRLYRPKAGGRLYPAPPRESLAIYGGPYTNEEYQKILFENRIRVDIQMPPMVSILGTLDTKPIDFFDSSLQNTFTQGLTAINDRQTKGAEGGEPLKLRRNRPLKDRESTLDACLQITFSRAVPAGV